MRAAGRDREHYEFLQRTDRKSLHLQIKTLVTKAQEVAAEEVKERSEQLKKQMEQEEKLYRQEFATTVQVRIDADILERSNALKAQMKAKKQQHQEFCERKRVQQVMQNCVEIRERLREENLRRVRQCQLEQIAEKRKQKEQENEVEKFWRDVENSRWATYDKTEEKEQCLRQFVQDQTRRVLKLQMEEQEEKRRLEREEKERETEEIRRIVEEIRREELEKDNREETQKMLAYRNELLKEIEIRKAAREAEAEAMKQEHLEFCRETERLEAEKRAKLEQQKIDFQHATQQYLNYVRRMRELEEGRLKMMNDRIDDLHCTDVCTKSNIAEMLRLKAEEAARCHAILKQQIADEAERRLREETEYYENKIIENRFVHDEETPEQINEKYRKHREDLDRQIKEMKRIREEEEQKFEQQLQKAIDDPNICAELAENYIRDGIDYLQPHPNWRLIVCPDISHLPNAPKTVPQILKELPADSAERCYCPEAERVHCGMMLPHYRCKPLNKTNERVDRVKAGSGSNKEAPQATNASNLIQATARSDMPPEGNNKQPRALRKCECPPGTRRHAMLMQAMGAAPRAGDF